VHGSEATHAATITNSVRTSTSTLSRPGSSGERTN
jgi:hypothetical protein